MDHKEIREVSVQGQDILVIPDALKHLQDPRLITKLESLGFPPDLFASLITLKHDKWIGDPDPDPEEYAGVETVKVRTADTPLGPVEVTDVEPFKSSPLKFHLRAPGRLGFEATLVAHGRIVYSAPKDVSPEAPGVYIVSSEEMPIELHDGDLIIIPATTARSVSDVDSGTTYRWLGSPWDESLMEEQHLYKE